MVGISDRGKHLYDFFHIRIADQLFAAVSWIFGEPNAPAALHLRHSLLYDKAASSCALHDFENGLRLEYVPDRRVL
jgi:hypothetical protein